MTRLVPKLNKIVIISEPLTTLEASVLDFNYVSMRMMRCK